MPQISPITEEEIEVLTFFRDSCRNTMRNSNSLPEHYYIWICQLMGREEDLETMNRLSQ